MQDYNLATTRQVTPPTWAKYHVISSDILGIEIVLVLVILFYLV